VVCLAASGSGCVIPADAEIDNENGNIDEAESALTTIALSCNTTGPGLSTSPMTFQVSAKAGITSYTLKFITSSATGTVNGKRPGVKGDGAFSGVNYIFPSGTTVYTVRVLPGTGRLWKVNTAGEGVFATSVQLLCQ